MRNLIAGAFVSLDGVMQAPGAPEEDPTGGFDLGGWTPTYWDDVMDEASRAIYSRPFDLIPGLKTYGYIAPHLSYSDCHPIAEQLNGGTKHIRTPCHHPRSLAQY